MKMFNWWSYPQPNWLVYCLYHPTAFYFDLRIRYTFWRLSRMFRCYPR